jgi:protein-L-isoaspartate(D-aspartate) O-methyltransferase
MPAATATPPDLGPDELREQMVAMLVTQGTAHTPEVVAALRAVPRHLVEGVEAAWVYDPFRAAVTKTGGDGVNLSSVSAAGVQTLQLEQAQIRPGQRVLEVGSGGVNAAYLAELVGPGGLVVTMDIDPDVTDRARAFLDAAGYPDVVVATGDAAVGVEQHAPFDVVLVTVEATDVPEVWWRQLAPAGRIVAPVRWRGQSRSVALVRTAEDLLVGDEPAQCGFVPMQGAGEDRQALFLLHDEPGRRVALRAEPGTGLAEPALREVFASERCEVWTGVVLGHGQSYDGLDLWLATVLDTQVMTADPGARAAGLAPSSSPIGWPALAEESGLAYRTLRATDDPQRWELGVTGHGPDAAVLAQRYAAAVRAWDPTSRPRMSVSRHTSHDFPGAVAASVRRRHCTVTISWS